MRTAGIDGVFTVREGFQLRFQGYVEKQLCGVRAAGSRSCELIGIRYKYGVPVNFDRFALVQLVPLLARIPNETLT